MIPSSLIEPRNEKKPIKTHQQTTTITITGFFMRYFLLQAAALKLKSA